MSSIRHKVTVVLGSIIFATLYYVRIYMGPFVTNNPRRLDEELIIEGPIKR